MSKFEEYIKKSVDQYEVDYNPNHWSKIESQLSVSSGGGLGKKIAIGSAIVITAASVAYFGFDSKENTIQLPTPIQQEQSQEPIIESSTKKPEAVIEDKVPNEVSKNSVEKAAKNTASSEKLEKATPMENAYEKPVNQQPIIETVSSDDLDFTIGLTRKEVCVKEAIGFTANIDEPVSYKWTFGDGNSSSLPEPKHQYKKAGKYSVSLEVTSLISNKTKRVIAGEPIIVNPQPQADFDYTIVPPEDFAQKVELKSSFADYKHIEWIYNDKIWMQPTLELDLNNKGNYPIKLVVANNFGCYDTIVKVVRVENDYNLLAPNAFTPDQDGINDVFLPKALENSHLPYKLEIYEVTSGKLIYKDNQDGRGWNGINMTTGTLANQGDYAWTVRLTKENGETEIFKGTLKLLRP
ncbi:PKD domain-containing protein [Luteibaculum oceani]|uniref:PKD domain-containing protein n=1 Tax=Luteibaculum oceani TaxID=1294296 RepID=A0A5C6V9Z5_9FLAO|nr:PKD domain-containing protein [Luteibaculum oceani]TXC81650.1 PKD domain-containing protein [Luteibaculum oceani]